MTQDVNGDGHRYNAEPTLRWRRRANRWMSTAFIASVISTVMLAFGFAYGTYAALGGAVGNKPWVTSMRSGVQSSQPPSVAKNKTVHLVALGDSLTHGLGDASGRGYVGDVVQLLRNGGYTVIQSNLGIDGLTSAGLRTSLKQPSVQSLIQSATLILISIGGNDLNDAAGLPTIHPERIASAQKTFLVNLNAIMTQITGINPNTYTILVGLYNPYGDNSAVRQQTNAIIESWDVKEDEVVTAFKNANVAHTVDLFRFNPSQLLYIDHFHPNQLGYQLIAERIWQDVQRVLT